MISISFDERITDDLRRKRLYDGQIFVNSPTPNSLALSELGREMAEAAFAPYDPREAQFHLAVEEYAGILAVLKPKFIHHPKSKECIQGILAEFGCDLEKTYFDVPRMRTSTAQGYLTTGIAFAFHPHRDTWYSAPSCQLNWWLPIYDVSSENGIAFHPEYWSRPVLNCSRNYNYQEWLKTSRFSAVKHTNSDTREQPKPEETINTDSQIRPVTSVGALTIFSAAQLHSSVPNRTRETRFSIDFRTVHLDDILSRDGAPNIDSACSGTTMGDYVRGADLEHLPESVIALYL